MDVSSPDMHLFDFVSRGGWTMWPLLACSIVSLAVIIERCIAGPRRSRVIPSQLQADIRELASRGRFEEIVGLCRASSSALARVVLVAVRSVERPREQLLEAIERAGRQETLRMQKHLATLQTIAAVAPLLGLLGTVSGMITTFRVIEQGGLGEAVQLSGGISEALITTATGLTIAIPTLIFYRIFQTRARALAMEMEQNAADFIDQLLASTPRANGTERTALSGIEQTRQAGHGQ
ncbi:MAG: MotA/TolQ/ExbB proton channel family protein [Bdellovibrionales bacterium]|nr:MotA/TolQ/ExbB proton channel family protein [Bdellovibrionales bacterium]